MKSGSVALILSALALGAAGFALSREIPEPTERSPVRMDRVAALETEVAELTREVRSLKAARPPRETPGALPATIDPQTGEYAVPTATPEEDSEIEKIVDEAVDRKAKQVMDELRVKRNKKPDIDLFASELELTEEQRALTERVVVDGQRKVHAILEIPTYDGSNLMDELVEIFARGAAEPGKDHGFVPWLGRVLSEKIPGTDDTYGARIEAVKNEMRATFEREWSAEQYREFREWGVDPTEVQNVPGSPNEQLRDRIVERARALGADIPERE